MREFQLPVKSASESIVKAHVILKLVNPFYTSKPITFEHKIDSFFQHSHRTEKDSFGSEQERLFGTAIERVECEVIDRPTN